MLGMDGIEAGNRDYQRQLAASLVGAMGVERAVHTCLDRGWDGVLENVLCAVDRGDAKDCEPGCASLRDLPSPARAGK
jgi:hypothetical protein